MGECQAGDSTTYRIFQPADDTVPVYDFCAGWDSPPSGVTCAEYQQGGAIGPLDCDHAFTTDTPKSLLFTPLTNAAVTYVGTLETWSSAGCTNINQGDASGKEVNECFTSGLQGDFLTWDVIAYGTIDN